MAKYDKFTSPKNEGRPVQVESAIRDGAGKNIENNYAKQNGSYSTLTAGLAEGIATDRTIEDADVSCPAIVFGTTGGDAEIQTGNNPFEELLGNSMVYNQGLDLGVDIAHGIHPVDGLSLTLQANGEYTFTANYTSSRFGPKNYAVTKGHIYLWTFKAKKTSGDGYMGYHNGKSTNWWQWNAKELTTDYQVLSFIWDPLASGGTISNADYPFAIHTTQSGVQCSGSMKDIMVFDLTTMGISATTLDEAIIALKEKNIDIENCYYPFNLGTILSSKAASLKSVGRNQWNEEWELGGYNDAGEKSPGSSTFRNKNFIRVLPDTDYYISDEYGGLAIFTYDANKNFIEIVGVKHNQVVHFDEDVHYINFYAAATSYNNDICIYINWDTPGLPYVAYREQVVELPNIELRSVGDVRDIAYQQGGGKRRIARKIITSVEGGYKDTYAYRGNVSMPGIVDSTVWDEMNDRILVNCDKNTQPVGAMSIFNPTTLTVSSYYNGDTNLYICAPGCTTQSQLNAYLAEHPIILNYILSEEAQTDISESENPGWTELIYTDNYGTLEFTTDPVQVPQVSQAYFIKYTVSLTEFLDSAYAHLDGDANDIAKQKEVDEIVSGAKKVGLAEFAENLTPYDEDSGTEQDEPFIIQASGTANGTLSDFASTNIAQLKEKRGNSIVVNQLVNASSHTDANVDLVVETNGVMTGSFITGNDRWLYLSNTVNLVVDHKFFVFFDMIENNMTPSNNYLLIGGGNGTTVNVNQNRTAIVTLPNKSNNDIGFIAGEGVQANDSIKFRCYVIDLTQMFGSNDYIPADLLAHPENFFRYYQGSLAYNKGELLDSNATKLKTIGRNQLNESEITDNAYIDPTDGSVKNDGSGDNCASPFIPVRPNTYYYLYEGGNSYGEYMAYYDSNKNFISGLTWYPTNTPMPTPANACYMRTTLKTVEKGKCCFSIYYSGESGYDQYYPYEELSNIDTGNEVLRSVKNSRDTKTSDGKIIRRVGHYTFTGEENISNDSGSHTLFSLSFDINAKGTTAGLLNDFGYSGYSLGANSYHPNCYEIYNIGGNSRLYLQPDESSITTVEQMKAFLTGKTIYYELITPIEEEEQGTPFAENLKIDDFGTMQFEAEEFNGIPMGNKIFYPVDYKAFVDTLHDYTQGAPSNLVLQSERTADKVAQASTDSALQAAVGGTLRQCLCVKESLDFDNTAFVDLGTLNWIYNNNNAFYSVDLNGLLQNQQKSITTKYVYEDLPATWEEITDKHYGMTANGSYIIIRDTNYIDATAFKNAMKGVLLAYEKASS